MQGRLHLRNRLDAEFSQESDRGCAILTVCLLEETLRAVFEKALPEGEDGSNHFMPKGRLSVGVANARCLGLLTDEVVSDFKCILEIRNTFAHKVLENLSFDTPEIKAKVLRLTLPNMDAAPTFLAEATGTSRKRYLMAIDNLFFTLEWLIETCRRIHRVQLPSWELRLRPVDS